MNPPTLLVRGARAAHLLAVLFPVLGVHLELQEGRHQSRLDLDAVLLGMLARGHGGSLDQRRVVALAARALGFFSGGIAGALLAFKLALGLGAQGRLLAVPVADRGFAHGRAAGLGGHTGSATVGRVAHRLTLGAVVLLAQVLGAAHGAHWWVALGGALSRLQRLALHFTLGTFAHRVALSRAGRVVARPSALRVALGSKRNAEEGKEECNEEFHF